jgi:myo-inositol-1(or 4)-monophosphatase
MEFGITGKTVRETEEFAGQILETAVIAARRAGAVQMEHFRDSAVRSTRLLDDVKRRIDRLCEEAVIHTIRDPFPDHAILTEESGALPGASEYTWIVDPLDGTTNFWHGLPFFCVSIACYLCRDRSIELAPSAGDQLGIPVAGVVFLPVSNELFTGIAGRGAFLGGQPICVTQSEDTRTMLATVSFGKSAEMRQRMLQRIEALLPHVQKGRCLGAVAAELAYVAAGFSDGMLYEGINAWDFAAGGILVQEAGGFFQATRTQTNSWQILACAPALRDIFASVLDRC